MYEAKHVYNLHKDLFPQKDFLFNPAIHLEKIATCFDIFEDFGEVLNQGQIGQCTGEAGINDFNVLYHQDTGKFLDLSAGYVYLNERKLQGSQINADTGSSGRVLMQSLLQYGVCLEPDYPSTIDNFGKDANKACYDYGSNHQALKFERILQLKPYIESAIMQRIAIPFGMAVYESFESDIVASDGVVSMPKENEQLLGYHEVTMGGYDSQGCKVRNSWGKDWGDNGNFYLPWEYVLNPAYCMDFMALQKVEIGE